MAKSLRSKRKRKMRRERREKFKVKEDQRLLNILGVNKAGKEEAMSVVVEEDSKDNEKTQEITSSEHVEVEASQNTVDIEMDQENEQKSTATSINKKKVNKKKLLKRLGKKKHPKKKYKW